MSYLKKADSRVRHLLLGNDKVLMSTEEILNSSRENENSSPRGEMKLRKNEMKLRKNEMKVWKNFSVPLWRMKSLHLGIADFLRRACCKSQQSSIFVGEEDWARVVACSAHRAGARRRLRSRGGRVGSLLRRRP